MKLLKSRLNNIKLKAAAIIASATGVLTQTAPNTAKAAVDIDLPQSFGYSKSRNRVVPKLVLKLNVSNPERSRVVSHSSHSSHESHSSHASHGSGYSGGNEGGGFVGPLLIVGGLVGYGLYKSSKNKK